MQTLPAQAHYKPPWSGGKTTEWKVGPKAGVPTLVDSNKDVVNDSRNLAGLMKSWIGQLSVNSQVRTFHGAHAEPPGWIFLFLSML